jgi:hypothetical protein
MKINFYCVPTYSHLILINEEKIFLFTPNSTGLELSIQRKSKLTSIQTHKFFL